MRPRELSVIPFQKKMIYTGQEMISINFSFEITQKFKEFRFSSMWHNYLVVVLTTS